MLLTGTDPRLNYRFNAPANLVSSPSVCMSALQQERQSDDAAVVFAISLIALFISYFIGDS